VGPKTDRYDGPNALIGLLLLDNGPKPRSARLFTMDGRGSTPPRRGALWTKRARSDAGTGRKGLAPQNHRNAASETMTVNVHLCTPIMTSNEVEQTLEATKVDSYQ
jgi:hypothetical protein